jgi:hypothetical protein
MTRLSDIPIGDVILISPLHIPLELVRLVKVEAEYPKGVYGTVVPFDDAVIAQGKEIEVTNALKEGYVLVNISMPYGPATIMLDGKGEVDRKADLI